MCVLFVCCRVDDRLPENGSGAFWHASILQTVFEAVNNYRVVNLTLWMMAQNPREPTCSELVYMCAILLRSCWLTVDDMSDTSTLQIVHPIAY